MAVSVVEVADPGAITSATTHTVTIATTPSAGDVLVVVNFRVLDATTSCSGCGATWSQAYTLTGASSAEEFDVFVGTGANASGTITVTQSTSRSGMARAFLVRGLPSTSVQAAHSVSGSATAQTITISSDTAPAGDFVLGLQISDRAAASGSTTFTATTPTTGWTIQSPVGSGQPTVNTGYTLPTVDETVNHSWTTTGTGRAYSLGTVIIGPAGSSGGATVAGAVTDLALAAPAGLVAAGSAVAGPSTDLTLAAPAGVVTAGVAVTGVLAQVAVAAPAGVVSAASSATVAGVTAAVAVASPAGAVTVSVDVPGPSAYVYTAAPAGSVTASSTVAGPAAAVTITALAGTAGARIITATPATRTLTVPIEARGVTVAAEPRALTVPAEPRTVTV